MTTTRAKGVNMKVDYNKCPTKPSSMEQDRYEDLCRLFAECDYDFATFEKKVEQLNERSPIIEVCHICGKVDISALNHYRSCDPEYEQSRRENQDVYWK